MIITQQPQKYLNSANNSSYYVVSSSNAGNTDFKYIADCVIGGVTETRLKTFPDPTTGNYGVFDIGGIIKNFVSFDFFPSASSQIFHSASNSSISFKLNFGEEYIAGNTFSQSLNLISSSDYYFLNSSIPFIENQSINFDNYVISSVINTTKQFLTKQNSPIKTYNNLKHYLYFFISSSASTYISITTFDSGGNQLGLYSVRDPYTTFQGVHIAGVGYPQLSTLVSGSSGDGMYVVEFGNPVMLNPQVSTYDIRLVGDGFVSFSDKKTYILTEDCGKFAGDAHKVYWLNTLGGFDSWLFNKKNQTTQTKTQSSYKKIVGKLNPNGSFVTNTYSRAVVPFYTQTQDKIDLTTDFLTDNDVIFLKGLFSSPVIFIEDADGNIFSATVDTSDYLLNKKVNNKIYSLQLSFLPSVPNFRQQL
jgi:hypothetical protein